MMPKHPCQSCVYYRVCGESTRTEPCNGRMTKRELKESQVTNQYATSMLVPTLHGKILRWIDDDQFIVLCKGREVLGTKEYWSIRNGTA